MRRRGESGFAMLLVFLMAASIAIMLYMQLPRAAFEAQRAKEELLQDRGEQYIRAIQLYVAKWKSYPPSLDVLEKTNNVRYLRKRYKDPMTGKDEWRVIHVNAAGQLTDSLVQKQTEEKKPNLNTFIGEMPTVGSTANTQGDAAQNVALRRRASDQAGAPGAPGVPGGAGQAVDPQALGNGAQVGQGLPGQPAQPGQPGQPPSPYFNPDPYGQNRNQPPVPFQPVPYGQNNPYGQPGQQGQPVPGQPSPGQPGQPPQPGQPNVNAGNMQYPVPTPPGLPAGVAGYPTAAAVQQDRATGTAGPSGSNQGLDMINKILTTPRSGMNMNVPGAPGLQIGGGIAGFASKHEAPSIKVYNERQKYNEWEFVYDIKKDKRVLGQAAGMMPGQPQNPLGNNSGNVPNPLTPGTNPGNNTSFNQGNSFNQGGSFNQGNQQQQPMPIPGFPQPGRR